MPVSLRHRNFLKELDFSAEELRHLIDLAAALKAAKAAGYERPTLTGRNIALIFQTISTRTRSAFEVAAHDQGAHVTYLGPEESPIGAEESLRDTARVLGRMFDGIEFRGADQGDVEELGRHAGVPVWNGLTDRWHPTQMLADVLTMREHSNGRLADIAYCYLGDGGNNIARSLLVTGALLGMDVRVAAPRELWPDEDLRVVVDRLAKESEARVLLTSDVEQAADGAGFVYTDAWLATGESRDRERRIGLLRPYQVTRAVLAATGNRHVRFMHCLPASHNRETRAGRRVYDETGLDALEVTEDVFESPASIVFEQAENRLHTTKAVMVATLGDGP